MKIFSPTILVLLLCVLLSSCAPANPQLQLRGNPNSPWTRMQYLRIDPNAMMYMSRAEYDELVRRVNNHNQMVAAQLQNDRTAAQNAQIWTGDVNRDRYYSIQRSLGRNFDHFLRRVIDEAFR